MLNGLNMAFTFSWIFPFSFVFALTTVLEVGSTTTRFSGIKVIDLSNNSKKPLNESINEGSDNAIIYHEMEQCNDNLKSYANKGSLCDVPDVQNLYRQESSRKVYTCEQRCGIAPTIGKLWKCECDEMCTVYGDCCKDFPAVCPEVHARGRVVYSHLTGLSVRCYDKRLAVVSDDTQALPTFPTMLPTSTTLLTSPKEYSFQDGQPSDFSLEWDFLSFKIIDTTFGVLFDSYASFNSRKIRTSKPVFIPKVAKFFCPAWSEGIDSKRMPAINDIRVSRILHWCSLSDVRDAIVWPYRKCFNPKHKVTCNCKSGLKASIYINLNEICSEKYKNYTRESMTNITHLENNYDKDYDFTKEQCALHLNVLDAIKEETERLEEKISMEMTFFPVFKSVDQTSNTLASMHDNYKEYVIEMTETIEKRFRCPNSNKFFFDCQLEECVKGALLWTNPPPQSKSEFKEGKCFLPALARVEAVGHPHGVPLCSCLSVTRAMVGLQTWKIKLNLTTSNPCILRLQRVPAERDRELLEPILDEHLKSQSFLRTSQDMKAELQKHLSSMKCPDDDIRHLNVCLYESEEGLATQSSDDVICLEFYFGQLRRNIDAHNSNRGHLQMSKISLIVAIAFGLLHWGTKFNFFVSCMEFQTCN